MKIYLLEDRLCIEPYWNNAVFTPSQTPDTKHDYWYYAAYASGLLYCRSTQASCGEFISYLLSKKVTACINGQFVKVAKDDPKVGIPTFVSYLGESY